MSKYLVTVIILIVILASFFLLKNKDVSNLAPNPSAIKQTLSLPETNPLMITEMRKQKFPGSVLKIEQTLADGSNYHQYIASYQSEGLKIYGLLTIPAGEKPAGGWPAIIFNHGYIAPEVYRTTERYVAYVDSFAKSGYVVFKSDYRGNGSSEGDPLGAYYSNAYTVDVLNALSSVKKLSDVNPQKIGMWGHSMGGNITLRSLVVDPADIKAAVIWGGVVGTYYDLINNWRRSAPFTPSPRQLSLRNRFRQELMDKYGSPSASSPFWSSIDPNSYLADVTAPVQLHAGLEDEEVPWQFSEGLYNRLKSAGKNVEFYTYPGTDHNISQSFNLAMQRSVEFFNKYLKD